ncbi:MAG TPA: hypothetical protein VEM41_01005 [Actinomycetota bacterium]|nr:hypothetical protein [Actinomycetota bacterium]
MPGERRPVVELAPALTNVPWAADVVTQSLEPLFVYLGDGGAHHLRPIHAGTLRLGSRAGEQPGEVVLKAARRYGLVPLLVHSTSWRMDETRVVLTYVVVVEGPAELNENLLDEPVARADLARGDALGGVPEIAVIQVIEHAFRHLSWLVKDDEAVRAALPDWVAFLERYEPEPFRAFGPSPG